jgi:purine-binding chemotaxis protein CheW
MAEAEGADAKGGEAPVEPPGEPMVTFHVAGVLYGIALSLVREIVRLGQLVPVPGAPRAILGITELRGEPLVVTDVRRVLGEPNERPAHLGQLIVLGDGGPELGLLADGVLDIQTVHTGALLAGRGAMTGPHNACIRGSTVDGLQVLDGRELLVDPQLWAQDEEG